MNAIYAEATVCCNWHDVQELCALGRMRCCINCPDYTDESVSVDPETGELRPC